MHRFGIRSMGLVFLACLSLFVASGCRTADNPTSSDVGLHASEVQRAESACPTMGTACERVEAEIYAVCGTSAEYGNWGLYNSCAVQVAKDYFSYIDLDECYPKEADPVLTCVRALLMPSGTVKLRPHENE